MTRSESAIMQLVERRTAEGKRTFPSDVAKACGWALPKSRQLCAKLVADGRLVETKLGSYEPVEVQG